MPEAYLSIVSVIIGRVGMMQQPTVPVLDKSDLNTSATEHFLVYGYKVRGFEAIYLSTNWHGSTMVLSVHAYLL